MGTSNSTPTTNNTQDTGPPDPLQDIITGVANLRIQEPSQSLPSENSDMPTTRSMSARVAHPVKCVSCLEETTAPIKIVNDEHVCLECWDAGIRPQFNDAIRNETAYPVKWGGTPINIQDHAHLFSADFLSRWQEKEKEYKTPVKERHYCKQDVEVIEDEDVHAERCNAFLGSKSKLAVGIVKCFRCTSTACSKCAEPVRNLRQHQCKTEEEDAFEGLARGDVWQVCPNEACRVKVTLWDGCNAMQCLLCGTRFCFICGSRTDHGHFGSGKPCPRFGKKGDPRAIHDAPVDPRRPPVGGAFRFHAPRAIDDTPVGPRRPRFGDFFQGHGDFFLPEPDPARVFANLERMEAELRHIAATPQALLETRHSETLDRLHDRVSREPTPDLRVDTLHDLIHFLQDMMPLYTFGLLPRQMGDFRNRHGNHGIHATIQDIVNELGDQGFRGWEELREIADTHMRVWDRTFVWE